MNNKRSGMGEQFLRSLVLSLAAMWLINHFFGWPGQPKTAPPSARTAGIEAKATLDNAFAGLNGAASINKEAAQKEVTSLRGEIDANKDDKYALWARLRSGLLQQYVLNQPSEAIKNYDEVIAHGSPDAIDAQAIFQKGDWQWRTAQSNTRPQGFAATLPTKQDAVWTLETLIHRGRMASAYLDTPIFVPKLKGQSTAPASNVVEISLPPADQIPAAGWEKVKVSSLRGTLENPHPLGILDRINGYYATTPLNRFFDGLVNFLGGDAGYSYGLAIIVLAILLRILMQPINRRQYDSMKGMQKIAPDMKKIQEKFKVKPTDSPEVQRDKQMKMLNESRALQKENGVSMQMGCVLGLVQMPVFFYLINPLMMHYEPKMQLVGATFGWFTLAHSDILLLALYGLSMLISFRLSSTTPTDDMQRQMQIMTTFVMPIMLPFFMKGFSAAFILYWISFNIVSMIFQYRMMKSDDPTKSVIKTLVGGGLIPPRITPADAAPAAVLPPRPKKSPNARPVKATSRVKSLSTADLAEAAADSDGQSNGSNGHHESDGATQNGDANGTTGVSGTITVSQKNANASNNGNTPSGSGSRARRRRRF